MTTHSEVTDTDPKSRLLWRIEDAVRYLGQAEYNAGTQAGTALHQAALAEATKQEEYLMGLIRQAIYG